MYKIIEAYRYAELTFKVNEEIQNGWMPCGSIAVCDNRFYQSMVDPMKVAEKTEQMATEYVERKAKKEEIGGDGTRSTD